MLTKREFHGEEFYKWALQDYENLRAFRNQVSTKGSRPSETEQLMLKLHKPWETFYGSILFDHTPKRKT